MDIPSLLNDEDKTTQSKSNPAQYGKSVLSPLSPGTHFESRTASLSTFPSCPVATLPGISATPSSSQQQQSQTSSDLYLRVKGSSWRDVIPSSPQELDQSIRIPLQSITLAKSTPRRSKKLVSISPKPAMTGPKSNQVYQSSSSSSSTTRRKLLPTIESIQKEREKKRRTAEYQHQFRHIISQLSFEGITSSSEDQYEQEIRIFLQEMNLLRRRSLASQSLPESLSDPVRRFQKYVPLPEKWSPCDRCSKQEIGESHKQCLIPTTDYHFRDGRDGSRRRKSCKSCKERGLQCRWPKSRRNAVGHLLSEPDSSMPEVAKFDENEAT